MNESGGVDKFDVPEYSKENLGICREALVEAVAETSEEFMDRYFGGEEFSDDEIRAALRANVLEGSIRTGAHGLKYSRKRHVYTYG